MTIPGCMADDREIKIATAFICGNDIAFIGGCQGVGWQRGRHEPRWCVLLMLVSFGLLLMPNADGVSKHKCFYAHASPPT